MARELQLMADEYETDADRSDAAGNPTTPPQRRSQADRRLD